MRFDVKGNEDVLFKRCFPQEDTGCLQRIFPGYPAGVRVAGMIAESLIDDETTGIIVARPNPDRIGKDGSTRGRDPGSGDQPGDDHGRRNLPDRFPGGPAPVIGLLVFFKVPLHDEEVYSGPTPMVREPCTAARMRESCPGAITDRRFPADHPDHP